MKFRFFRLFFFQKERKFYRIMKLLKVNQIDIPDYLYYVSCNGKRMIRLSIPEKSRYFTRKYSLLKADVSVWNTYFCLLPLGNSLVRLYNLLTTGSLEYQFGSLLTTLWYDKTSLFLKTRYARKLKFPSVLLTFFFVDHKANQNLKKQPAYYW